VKERPNRKLQRLSGYDYSQNGIYFITICSDNRKNLFGFISNAAPVTNQLSSLGLIVQNAIEEIPFHHKDIQILTHVIMPNHVHLLLEIDQADTLKTSTDLSSIVKGFKAYVSRSARDIGMDGQIWQKSFHDHIIRDELDLKTHHEYILSNIDRWREDEYCNAN